MENSIFDPKKALLLTRIIYFSLLTGIFIFLIVSVIVLRIEPVNQPDLSGTFFPVLLIMTCVAIPGGYLASKKYFSRADKNSGLGTRYAVYQSGLIISLAAFEGTALFSIVCYLITGNQFTLVFLGAALLAFFYVFPTPAGIAKEINLTEAETEKFYNQDSMNS